MDLGECPKVHDLALRADYEKAAKHKDYYYDIDVSSNPLHILQTEILNLSILQAMEHLQAFIADCDRRTIAAKKRLAETQEELTAEVAVKANVVHQLAEEIGKKLAKAEALGEAGEVEESVQLMAEIDELRAKKVQAEQEYRSSMPASSYQQQKLRVCEVCSAYLGIHDNDIRLADHFGGKLHLGFMAIRDKLSELEKTAGPRKNDMKKSGRRDRDYEDSSRYGKNRYYVGGRELDRRCKENLCFFFGFKFDKFTIFVTARVHRSRSREKSRREERKSESSSKRRSRSRSRSRSRGYSSRRRRSSSRERR